MLTLLFGDKLVSCLYIKQHYCLKKNRFVKYSSQSKRKALLGLWLVGKYVNILDSRCSLIFNIIIVKDSQPALLKLAGQNWWVPLNSGKAHLHIVSGLFKLRTTLEGTWGLLYCLSTSLRMWDVLGCTKQHSALCTMPLGTQGTQFICSQVTLQFCYLVPHSAPKSASEPTL